MTAVLLTLVAQAGLLIPTSTGRPDAAVVSLREMTIEAEIARGYARVNVRQVFENHTDAPQEGSWRFALPPSAAVGDFAVWDGLVRIPGMILEKRRARAIYRDLTTQRIDPGLLQQGDEDDRGGDAAGPARPSGGSLFSVAIAPIPSRGTKRLELQFQQEVPLIGGSSELRVALRANEGLPARARTLRIRVRSADSELSAPVEGLTLAADADGLGLTAKDALLDKDLVVRLRPRSGTPVLRLTAFRAPDGRLPDGIALAPWERAAEIPPEKDGFFLLEYAPHVTGGAADGGAVSPPRQPGQFVFLFDSSLSHRFAGLESSYALLADVLRSLTPADRFAVIAFDRQPEAGPVLEAATAAAIDASLLRLRARLLAPGTDVASAVARARAIGGAAILLLTDGSGRDGSQALRQAAGGAPLFVSIGGAETPESLRNAARAIVTPLSSATERSSFIASFLAGVSGADSGKAVPRSPGLPFQVKGGDARIRDVYPVMVQPVAPGSASGWIGRYAAPQPSLRFSFNDAAVAITAALPEAASEARDLPRRWARARVDELLRRVEAEGETRALVDEIVELSRRYKFVTPYTAFLAAPRSLLRPRRIQPGDPVLRVECDARTVAATALFPFGLRLPLRRRPQSNVWEGRFLVPSGLRDGRYTVRILIKDESGLAVSENKEFVIDGTAPRLTPQLPATVRMGDSVLIAAGADEDVIVLTARFGEQAPVALRWDSATRRSVGTWRVPANAAGRVPVLFEAVDAAKNHSFVRATVLVQP